MKDATARALRTSVVPVMRYRDLPAAIDWLCRAFGFERHRITAGKDGGIMFAQLTFGTAMVMVGPVRKSAFDRYLRQPDEIGGAETQVCYFSVEDAHAHCARARAAGAQILFDIEDRINGGRSYSCRDLEGHLWNFGSYDPWRERATAGGRRDRPRRVLSNVARRLTLVAALLTAGAVVVLPMAIPFDAAPRLRQMVPANSAAKSSSEALVEQLNREHEARAVAQRAHKEAQAQLQQALAALRGLLAQARSEKVAAERSAAEARDQLLQAREEKETAERAAKVAWDQVLKAGIAKSMAQRAARDARRQLARERSARTSTPTENNTPLLRWE